jgi:hypothetical protein
MAHKRHGDSLSDALRIREAVRLPRRSAIRTIGGCSPEGKAASASGGPDDGTLSLGREKCQEMVDLESF